MNEIATTLGVDVKLLWAILALIIIAVVYEINAKAGWILGLLAMLAILTKKGN